MNHPRLPTAKPGRIKREVRSASPLELAGLRPGVSATHAAGNWLRRRSPAHVGDLIVFASSGAWASFGGSPKTDMHRDDRRSWLTVAMPKVVADVIAFESPQAGCKGSRRAIARWSDGDIGEALRWWDDEVLFCEGDLIGKTEAELRALHFSRDRDYLGRTDHHGRAG